MNPDQDIIEERWKKKRASITTLRQNLRRLRRRLTIDLKSENEKDFLTACVIKLMLKTSERVGNENSAGNGHFGVTGFRKNHVTVDGNTITLEYRGKSGVDHKKVIRDKQLAPYIQKAMDNSPSKRVFTTSDGFDIKNDRINRYLQQFDVTSKDIRGYGANMKVIESLKRIDPESTEDKRKRQINKIIKKVANEVGHGAGTLQKHYMLPELKPTWVEKGHIVTMRYDKGGELKTIKPESKNDNPPAKKPKKQSSKKSKGTRKNKSQNVAEPKITADMNDSVGIALLCQNRILLVHHPDDNTFHSNLSIPKGTKEAGESDIETATREIKEETGINIPRNWFENATMYKMPVDGRNIVYFVMAIEDPMEIGQFCYTVHPNQYQKEEVDYAGFIKLEDAPKYLQPDQLPVASAANLYYKNMGDTKVGQTNNTGSIHPDHEYQFRKIDNDYVYYSRKPGDLWTMISKEEYDRNVNDNNIVFQSTERLAESFDQGGIIEGKLHSECDEDGCGRKFDIRNVDKIIEAERDEAVILPPRSFEYSKEITMTGTVPEIASALNVLGGGKNFEPGATVEKDGMTSTNVGKIPSDTDVEDTLEPGSIIINRKNMYDRNKYKATGTPRQIASLINSLNGNGKEIEKGGSIKKI